MPAQLSDDARLALYVEELKTWDKQLEPLRETWRLMRKEWTPHPPGKPVENNQYVSNVRIPWGFHAVETIHPRVVGFDPKMRFKALDNRDDLPIAHLMGGLTTWQMERMGFELEARDFLRQGLKIGYTVAIFAWVREELEVDVPRENRMYDPELGTSFVLEQSEKKTMTVKNAPFFETINVADGDFVWPILARNLDEASAVWQRRWVTKRYLKERRDVYKNVDKVEATASSRLRESRREHFEHQDVDLQTSLADHDDDEGIVELWSRWSDTDLCVIANPHESAVKVRDDPNPFEHQHKPFVDWSPIPEEFQMHGVGIIQVIYDQNEDLNALRRQRRDAITYTLNPAWKSRGALRESQLTIFPGKVFDLDSELDELEPMTQPPTDFSASYQEEQEIKRDMQLTTGAHASLAGQAAETAQTATEFAGLQTEGNVRIGEMIKVFEQRSMMRFGHLLAMMNAQFVDEETAVDFSDDPEALQAWQAFQQTQKSTLASVWDSIRGRNGSEGSPEPDAALLMVTPEMVKAKGRLEPIPDVGQDRLVNEIQKRSDATQFLQALQPVLALPQALMLLNAGALLEWVAEQFGVDKMTRQKLLQVPPQQMQAILAQAQLDNMQPAESGPSGESGENAPTGNVVGTPGAAGPIGPPVG